MTEKKMTKSEEARRAWNKENMKTVATNLRKEDAEAFRAFAEKEHTTPSNLIKRFITDTIGGKKEKEPVAPHGIRVKAKTYDRLMHFTSFSKACKGNPDENADWMLNVMMDLLERIEK